METKVPKATDNLPRWTHALHENMPWCVPTQPCLPTERRCIACGVQATSGIVRCDDRVLVEAVNGKECRGAFGARVCTIRSALLEVPHVAVEWVQGHGTDLGNRRACPAGQAGAPALLRVRCEGLVAGRGHGGGVDLQPVSVRHQAKWGWRHKARSMTHGSGCLTMNKCERDGCAKCCGCGVSLRLVTPTRPTACAHEAWEVGPSGSRRCAEPGCRVALPTEGPRPTAPTAAELHLSVLLRSIELGARPERITEIITALVAAVRAEALAVERERCALELDELAQEADDAAYACLGGGTVDTEPGEVIDGEGLSIAAATACAYRDGAARIRALVSK